MSGWPVAHIKLGSDEAARMLDDLCAKTGTDRAFWDRLAEEFITAQSELAAPDASG